MTKKEFEKIKRLNNDGLILLNICYSTLPNMYMNCFRKQSRFKDDSISNLLGTDNKHLEINRKHISKIAYTYISQLPPKYQKN